MLYSVNVTEKTFNENISWVIKFIFILSNIFSFINFIIAFIIGFILQFYFFYKKNIALKPALIQIFLTGFFSIVNYKLYDEIENKKNFYKIIPCISWGNQIIKNFIFNNKYILPFFYYIFYICLFR